MTPDEESKAMLVVRLQAMLADGHVWLTIRAVLSLINDCDMLASRKQTVVFKDDAP